MSHYPDRVAAYLAVPAIGGGTSLEDDIREWTSSQPLRDLVEDFGGDSRICTRDDLFERLRLLDEFSDRWDTRKGQERNLADQLDLTPGQSVRIIAAADALGLVESRPPEHHAYDHVLVLGGLLRACLARPARAAQLIQSGDIVAGAVTALGGHRPFRGDEFELAQLAGLPDLGEEFAALDAGTRRAFGLGEPLEVTGVESSLPGGAWTVHGYKWRNVDVRVAAAPSSEPAARRANTADSYEWFARTIGRLEGGEHVLIITTTIYVPAQHAAALRMLALPHDVKVETVGIEPGAVISQLAQTFTPSHYLQEIRSAIRSIRDLVVYVGGTAP
ncbi:MAG: hypothetical protein QOD07_2037 [Frankiaceae bacterium]|jgi:hypothetical protein|nr:hypothetical protein [Frankiaceae bacterium]